MEGQSQSQSDSDEVVEMGMGGGSSNNNNSSNGGSRWNPTKEQINMLESLYKQGIRTPTADQIQQITARLSLYGHIEGKNVFYWFQNHKARQRQKQKQDTLAYFNRFLHAPHHVFSPPTPFYPHVMCAPYCMAQAQSEAVYYPKGMVVPVGVVPMGVNEGGMQERISDLRNQETLELFPMHPTGILEGKQTLRDKKKVMVYSSSAAADATTTAPSGAGNTQPFFDFFTHGQGGSVETTGGFH